MPTRDAFLAAIVAAIDDPQPRLIFADWLDDHGQPAEARAWRETADRVPYFYHSIEKREVWVWFTAGGDHVEISCCSRDAKNAGKLDAASLPLGLFQCLSADVDGEDGSKATLEHNGILWYATALDALLALIHAATQVEATT